MYAHVMRPSQMCAHLPSAPVERHDKCDNRGIAVAWQARQTDGCMLCVRMRCRRVINRCSVTDLFGWRGGWRGGAWLIAVWFFDGDLDSVHFDGIECILHSFRVCQRAYMACGGASHCFFLIFLTQVKMKLPARLQRKLQSKTTLRTFYV